jgi:hypothetical protein
LDGVLSEGRFYYGCSPFQCLKNAVTDRLQQLLNSLLRPALDLTSSWWFLGLFLALVAGIGYLVLRGAVSKVVGEMPASAGLERSGTSDALLQEAKRHEQAGDFRLALRALFLGVMLRFQEDGVIELRPGLTNRDYLREVRARRAASAPSFSSLVAEFERAWYGGREVDASRYAQVRQATNNLLTIEPQAA